MLRVRGLGDWSLVTFVMTSGCAPRAQSPNSVFTKSLPVELGAGKGVGAEAQRGAGRGQGHTASESCGNSAGWAPWGL